ncbi:acetylxylan esterase [Phytoactinopolyspora limicola]|uniref:acetylxylan esterase n=1 Tax=Phytoactinopolyspora limicola TaxID=2715536 RepID=UPI001A9C3B26|nr:acetylxylan esterase [Phytoactinopolyspora limicola]
MPAPYDRWFGPDAVDATFGYDEAMLRAVGAPEEPPGFAEFWQGLHEQARRVDPAVQLTAHAPAGCADIDLFDVSFTSLHGVRLGGWVVLPSDGVIDQAAVIGHGYGGRDAPDLTLLPDHTAAIFPVARGLPSRGLLPGVPADAPSHVLHGIEARDTYIHGGCAADVWCAATALLDIVAEPPARLAYVGGSFGGGIGALAVPWDERFTAAALHVPSFGHHPLRLTMPCTGSGEAVRRHARAHPEVVDVLRFFDAAVAARRLRIPTLLAPALWDPAVPPPGQFAVCNAVPSETEFYVFSAGHAEYPGDDDEHSRYVARVHALLRS